MSVVRKRVTFTASEVKPNLLTGLVEEFLNRPSAIRIYGSQIAAGEVELDVQVGNVSVAKDVSPSVQASGVIKRNEDLLVTTVGYQGDRIQIRARELTAGAGTELTYMVEISELA